MPRGGGFDKLDAAAAKMATAMESAADALSGFAKALEESTTRVEGFGASAGGAAGGGGAGLSGTPGTGGRSPAEAENGALAALAGRAAAAGPAIAAAGVAGSAAVAGAGFVAAGQGGTFEGGAREALNDIAAAVPVVGELGGFAPAQRAREDALASLNSATGDIDALAGPDAIGGDVRDLLARTAAKRANNRERGRQLNRAALREQDVQRTLAAGLGPGAEGIAAMARDQTVNLLIGQAGLLRGLLS